MKIFRKTLAVQSILVKVETCESLDFLKSGFCGGCVLEKNFLISNVLEPAIMDAYPHGVNPSFLL